MRAVRLRVVHPEEMVTPWYKTRPAVITGKVLWWLLTFLWGLTKALAMVLVVLVSVVLMMVGFVAHFVGGPPR
jgi:hypothetical protein